MFSVATLWIPFTIIAALGQVARNAMQRHLTGPLGTWGATNIRFLFGLPCSVVFFAAAIAATAYRGRRRRFGPGSRSARSARSSPLVSCCLR